MKRKVGDRCKFTKKGLYSLFGWKLKMKSAKDRWDDLQKYQKSGRISKVDVHNYGRYRIGSISVLWDGRKTESKYAHEFISLLNEETSR